MMNRTLFIPFVVLLTAVLFIPTSSAQYPDQGGYSAIFNSSNLDGWTMQWDGLWSVNRGILTGKQDPATGKDSWLFTDQEWDDFALSLQFKMTANCNSGVGIRMPKGQEGRPSQYGYEIQISDIDEKFPTGSIFRHVPASQKLHKGTGWHTMEILCVQDHIVVYLNKQKIVDARLDGSKKGRIGLQVHGGEALKDQVVEFRNVRIKDLKPQYDSVPSPVQFKAIQIDDLLSEGCSVADVNNDGKLDITCGPNWYEAPSWTPHSLRDVQLSGEYMSNFGEFAMDVNQDGWIDVISGGWFSDELCWFENPGSKGLDQKWAKHVIDTGIMVGTETIYLCDVDHDGRSDILMNYYNRDMPATYYGFVGLDKSDSGFAKRVIGFNGRGHGAGYGDVDGDGLGDFITSTGWYKAPLNPLTETWKWTGNFSTFDSSVPFLVDDLNEDGLNDLIYGNGHDFGLHWLEQTFDSAGRQAWISHTIDNTYSQSHCPQLADLNGDGTLDIISGKRYRGHNGGDPGANEPLCIFWYEVKKGPDPKFIKHTLTYDQNIGVGMNMQVADIDFDGDLDIIAPGKTGLYLLENQTR